jgi:2-oxoisovalerate dehydrogenase E1 component
MDRLFEEHEVVAEIICPTQIYPLRIEPIVDSSRVSGRMLVVEEGQLFCGFGAEVVAAVHEACSGTALVTRRLGAAAHPLPCCKSAEIESLPGVDSIVKASLEMLSDG